MMKAARRRLPPSRKMPLFNFACSRPCLLLLALLLVSPLAAARAPEEAGAKKQTLRVYHVGNSVTDTIRPGALAEMARSRGHRHVWGRHMIPGAPLSWIYEHLDSGFKEEPFGYYPKALSRYPWDVLTLQPFDRLLTPPDGDLAMAKKFLDLALPQSPNLHLYVYSRWPRKNPDGSLDYEKKWLRRYTGGWDGTEETRDYFERLTRELRAAYPKRADRIFLVPVGDVLLELDRRMKVGAVPGYADVSDVYTDGIHLNNVGSFIVGTAFFAALYREDPRGLPSAPYGVNDPKLARQVQDAVWTVVRRHPLAGVARPAAAPPSKGPR
jgi:hypothetical protein